MHRHTFLRVLIPALLISAPAAAQSPPGPAGRVAVLDFSAGWELHYRVAATVGIGLGR